jgi:glycerol-3-phosphate acyltransferase PlsY
MELLYSLLAIVAAYLVGSLSFAVIVSRLMGLADPRSYGSKNPGATNVLRSGNRAAAVLTLAFDALKGYVPVLAAAWAAPRAGWGSLTIGLVGLAAFVGHLWPVFFRFQGGKGVATAAGVLLALNTGLGAATLLTWVIVAYFFRFSSLASLVSAAFAPFYQLLIWGASTQVLAIAVMRPTSARCWPAPSPGWARKRPPATPRRTMAPLRGRMQPGDIIVRGKVTENGSTLRRGRPHVRDGRAQRRVLPRRPGGGGRRAGH